MNDIDLLKEKTKARMLKNAARLWGAEDVDIELNFDPLITLLIEGCVNEIGKISHEINNSHARVINRLAQILSPDILTCSLPAHAIMHARPNEDASILGTDAQFYYTAKVPGLVNPQVEENKDFHFSPVSPVNLVNGTMRYMAFHDKALEIVNVYQKSALMKSERGNTLSQGDLWIGLDLSQTLEDLEGLMFYFDLRNNPYRENFLQLMPFARMSLEGFPLPVENGLGQVKDLKINQLENEYDADNKIKNLVRIEYERSFKTISESTKDAFKINLNKRKYPTAFESVFSAADLQQFETELLWIKVDFPLGVSEQMLSDLYGNINCFPVVNKKHNELTYKLSQNLNVLPLKTPDYFLSVKQIKSMDGHLYENHPLGQDFSLKNGSYALRQGGIERFNERNALETVNYLIDLLRDESAAFSMLDNDFLAGSLKQLNQILVLLEQNSSRNKKIDEPTYYLMVSPKTAGENITVSFWSTCGEIANNVKAGNKLNISTNDDVQTGSLILLTTTTGGRKRMNDEQQLGAFKQALISRGRVVTEQDIKIFCMNEAGKEIRNVLVKRGYAISDNPKEGFFQTMDVILSLEKTDPSSELEWTDRCNLLALKLNKVTSGILPIRVYTEDAYSKKSSVTSN